MLDFPQPKWLGSRGTVTFSLYNFVCEPKQLVQGKKSISEHLSNGQLLPFIDRAVDFDQVVGAISIH